MRIPPALEQTDVSNRIKFDQPIDDPANVAVFTQPLRALICPSDSTPGVLGGRTNLGTAGANTTGAWGTTNYKAVAGGNREFNP